MAAFNHEKSLANHRITRWTFADDTARLAKAGLTSLDVDKVAKEISTGTYWIVTAVASGVPTWAFLAGSAGAWQAPITLTTTGTSGAATFIADVLNIPNYSGGGGGGLVNLTEDFDDVSPNDTVEIAGLRALGTTTDVDFLLAPKGAGSIMVQIPDGGLAGGTKRGLRSFDFQHTRYSVDSVVSGDDSGIFAGADNKVTGLQSGIVAGGTNNIAATSCFIGAGTSNIITVAGSNSAIVGGSSNNISSTYCFASGISNTISAGHGIALGRSHTVDGEASICFNSGAKTYTVINKAVFGGSHSEPGTTHSGILTLSGMTTGATAKILTSDGSGTAGAYNIVAVQSQQAVAFTGLVVAKRQNSTTYASWTIEGSLVRGALASTTVLTTSGPVVITNTPGWTLALTADTTNGGLRITFTGATSTNIRIVASIFLSESLYA